MTVSDQTPCSPGELRILLVEDSPLLQDRLVEMLRRPGVMRVVGAAATEQEARRLIDAGFYDVLLVDVELSEGTGIGAIEHARQSYPPKLQPVIIVLTNYPLASVRERCYAAGADHFLDKVRQFHELSGLLEEVGRGAAAR